MSVELFRLPRVASSFLEIGKDGVLGSLFFIIHTVFPSKKK